MSLSSSQYKRYKRLDVLGQLAMALLGYLLKIDSQNRLETVDLGFIAFYLAIGGWQILSTFIWAVITPKGWTADGRLFYWILLGVMIMMMVARPDVVSVILTVLIGSAFLAVYYLLLTLFEGTKQKIPSKDAEPEGPDSTTRI
jgi:hypothetical protein